MYWSGDDLLWSIDGGQNWNLPSYPPTDADGDVRRLRFVMPHATDPAIVIGSSWRELYISSDYGDSWTMTREFSSNCRVDITALSNGTFVTSDCESLGLLSSSDGGNNWEEMPMGILVSSVVEGDGGIFISTDEDGIWEIFGLQ